MTQEPAPELTDEQIREKYVTPDAGVKVYGTLDEYLAAQKGLDSTAGAALQRQDLETAKPKQKP